MKINHHNYEEYFILYMDNELSSEDRRMVENFIAQHPDLKDELELLSQYKLEPDTSIMFPGKEDLMKVNGDSPITIGNYEEWFVLHADNELTPSQIQAVEEFLIANPALRAELDLFKRSKLEPETVSFGDKSSLYRKEEKVRVIRWWRIAAAAILLLAAGISAVLVINRKNTDTDPGLATKSQEIKTTPVSPVVIPQPSNTSVTDEIANVITPVVEKKKKEQGTIAKTNDKGVNKQQPENAVIKQDRPAPDLANNKNTNNLPLPSYNPNVIKKEDDNKPSIASNSNQKDDQQKSSPTIAVTQKDPQPSNIKQAADITSDVAFEQSNEQKKNKSRGLFRKIARTLEKRTSIEATDDNKLLVAGLAIRLK